MSKPFDIVVRGGTIIDGSGGAPFCGDVAIKGDKILAVGELAPTITSEEDELAALAKGLREAGSGVFQLISGAHLGKDPAEEVGILVGLELSFHPFRHRTIDMHARRKLHFTKLVKLFRVAKLGWL